MSKQIVPLINPLICHAMMFLVAVWAALQPLEKTNALPEHGVSTTLDKKHDLETNGSEPSNRIPEPRPFEKVGSLNSYSFSDRPLEITLPFSEQSLGASNLEPLSEIIPSQVQEISVTPDAEPAAPPKIPRFQTDQLFTQATAAPEPLPEETLPFGEAGQKYWYVQGAGAVSFADQDESAVFGLAGVGISQFFADGHSINAELNTLGFIQPDEDALGLNLAVLLRWHFYRQPNWSLYIDGGAGILGTTSAVPSLGSQFNFTPQVGGGATFSLGGAQQLMVGLRWHHISNANLYDSNPGRDSIMLYGGWIISR